MTPRAASTDAGGELSSDLQALGINLRDLQVRIETAADLETLPLTDGRLQEIEAVRAAVAALEDVITRARNRAVAQAVAARWPYKRIHRVTGLSIEPHRPDRPSARRARSRGRAHNPQTQGKEAKQMSSAPTIREVRHSDLSPPLILSLWICHARTLGGASTLL